MVCVGGPERPCYKMAYFHDVSSRVAFNEAHQACKMDGGVLLSIDSAMEQKDIEHLLQVRFTQGPSLPPLSPPPSPPPTCFQELRSGAVGGAGGGGGIADGDFWIGLTRADGLDQTPSELSNTFTSCPKLYQWTDGSTASFR